MSSSKITGLRPDLTLAQLVALVSGGVPVVLQLLVAFAVFDPDAAQTEALNTATQWLGLLAIGLFGGDAAIRFGRNLKDGKVEAAALTGPTPPTPPQYAFGTMLQGEPIKGEVGTFEHEDMAAAFHSEGLPTDDEEFGRAGDTRPPEESPV